MLAEANDIEHTSSVDIAEDPEMLLSTPCPSLVFEASHSALWAGSYDTVSGLGGAGYMKPAARDIEGAGGRDVMGSATDM